MGEHDEKKDMELRTDLDKMRAVYGERNVMSASTFGRGF